MSRQFFERVQYQRVNDLTAKNDPDYTSYYSCWKLYLLTRHVIEMNLIKYMQFTNDGLDRWIDR